MGQDHIIERMKQAWRIVVNIQVQRWIHKYQTIRLREIPLNQQIRQRRRQIPARGIPDNHHFLHLTVINLPEHKPQPHIGLKAVIQPIGKGVLWGLAVVD